MNLSNRGFMTAAFLLSDSEDLRLFGLKFDHIKPPQKTKLI